MDVITPAVGEGAGEAEANTTALGEPKLARLNTLKNSARNCSCTFSVSAVSLQQRKIRTPPCQDRSVRFVPRCRRSREAAAQTRWD